MSESRIVSAASRALNGAVLALVSLIGVVAFTYPFLQPIAVRETGPGTTAHAQDALLLFVVLIVLCLGAVLGSMSSSKGLNSKMIAALGILTAVNAVLRLIPGPGPITSIPGRRFGLAATGAGGQHRVHPVSL